MEVCKIIIFMAEHDIREEPFSDPKITGKDAIRVAFGNRQEMIEDYDRHANLVVRCNEEVDRRYPDIAAMRGNISFFEEDAPNILTFLSANTEWARNVGLKGLLEEIYS